MTDHRDRPDPGKTDHRAKPDPGFTDHRDTAALRVLVAATPGVGHLLPLLPVARAARARGHDVRIAAGRSLEPIATDAGFAFEPVGPASLDVVIGSLPGIAGLTGRRRAVVAFRDGFCGAIAASMADDLGRVIEAWRPDVVVREDMAFGAAFAAELAGIPAVTIQATAWRPPIVRLASEPLGALRARLGLAADPELRRLYGAAYATTRPPSLRDPDAPMPSPTLEVRPIADDRRGPDAAGAPEDPYPPRDGRPRVAVTLGTVNAGQLDVMRRLVEGAVAADAEVIVALGADPATYGTAPEHVAVRDYVPMSELLPASDIVVSHGGSGTMLAAAAAAVPMVIVPLGADQPDNADRCRAAGIAVVVELEDCSVDAIRDAIRTVLDDPAYRARSAAIAAEIAAMPGPEVLITELEGLASTS